MTAPEDRPEPAAGKALRGGAWVLAGGLGLVVGLAPGLPAAGQASEAADPLLGAFAEVAFVAWVVATTSAMLGPYARRRFAADMRALAWGLGAWIATLLGGLALLFALGLRSDPLVPLAAGAALATTALLLGLREGRLARELTELLCVGVATLLLGAAALLVGAAGTPGSILAALALGGPSMALGQGLLWRSQEVAVQPSL